MVLPTTLERLRVFHAIASAGSVAAAARRLGYTPSAVSQHLGALEREAGCALVERSSRGVALTAAGNLLTARASAILDLVGTAFDDVAASAGRLDAELSVAAFPTAITSLLIPAMSHLPQTLRLRIVHAEPQNAVRALVTREVDCALVDHYSLQGSTHVGLDRTLIRTEPVQLVTRARRTPTTLAGYSDHAWVLGGPPNRLAAAVRAACTDAGFVPNVIAETDDHHVTFDIVRATGAVSILPELALASVPKGITVVWNIASMIERRIELVTRESMRSNTAFRVLADALGAERR
jgi:DNA-binding transcriptional LysR family regulator